MNGFLLFFLHLLAGIFLFQLKWTWFLIRNGCKIPGGKWWQGLPLLGDGLHFLRNPELFWDLKRARYGSTFLTNLFGMPTIMTSTPETVKFVLQTQFSKFSPSYPRSMDRILNGTGAWEGEFHLRMRKVLQAPLLPESLKSKMDSFDALARWIINSWKHKKGEINVHEETRNFSLHVALAAICSVQPNQMTMSLLEKYTAVGEGLTSLPLNIPGFAFYKAMQAKKEIVEQMQHIIDARRAMRTHTRFNDIVESFLVENSRAGGQAFSDLEMRVSLFIVLIAGHESTATLLAWVVKFLTEHPDTLRDVQQEQESVRRSKRSADEPLSWADIKQMPLTGRVIQESLRLGNPVPLTPRIALRDVQHNGYLISKGWRIFLNYRNVHMDPNFYPNPSKFDPSRFEDTPKPYTFMPFGGGSRYCLGNELVKVESLIFIHYLVTSYSWQPDGADRGVQFWPSPRPRGGYPIIVQEILNGSTCTSEDNMNNKNKSSSPSEAAPPEPEAATAETSPGSKDKEEEIHQMREMEHQA